MSPADDEHPQRAPGLRERKREKTRAEIRRSALELIERDGYQDVTVEMICAAAGVSRRTFFNYFGSKEAVVVGDGPRPLSDQAQERFVHEPQDGILMDLARMMLDHQAERPRDADPAQWRAHLEVLRREPALAKALADRIAAKNADLEALVARRLRAQRGPTAVPTQETDADPDQDSELARRAGFIVAMWWGIARYAIQQHVEHPDADPAALNASLLRTLALIQEERS